MSVGIRPERVRVLMLLGFTYREIQWLERIAARARKRSAGIDPGPLRS